MIIRVTEEAIEGAKRYDINNPLIFALQSQTGTVWLMSECGVVQEVTPPYRTFILPQHIIDVLEQYRTSGSIEPFDFEAELKEEHDKERRGLAE